MKCSMHFLNPITAVMIQMIHQPVVIILQPLIKLKELKRIKEKLICLRMCVLSKKLHKIRKLDTQILWMFAFLTLLTILLHLLDIYSKWFRRVCKRIQQEHLKQFLWIITDLLTMWVIWMMHVKYSVRHRSKRS